MGGTGEQPLPVADRLGNEKHEVFSAKIALGRRQRRHLEKKKRVPIK